MRTLHLQSMLALALMAGAPLSAAAAPGPTAPAETEEAGDFSSPGAYVGLGALYAIELFDGSGPGGDADGSIAVRGVAGFRVHPHIAIEAIYENYLEFDIDPSRIRGWSIGGNVKGFILTGDIQPYLVLGAGYLDLDSTPSAPASAPSGGTGAMLRIGGGTDFFVTENWALGPRLEYVLPFGDVEDLDFLLIAAELRYKF